MNEAPWIPGGQRVWLGARCAAVCLGWVALAMVLGGCSESSSPEAVVYCAQDQVYAEPILREAGQRLGIRVRPVFDSEAVKTAGLVNRLLAERSRPRCDVFWGNEELRTRQLAALEVFAPDGWAAFGYRSRRVVVNTRLLPPAQGPRSLLELTNAAWKGKVAIAYPLFGATATHFHALRQSWGADAWEAWCRALAANQPLVVDGNSVVVKMVGQGQAWVGLTDSDDIAAGQREGLPVAGLPLTGESLLLPNTVGWVRDGPNGEAGRRLFEELRQPWVAERLVAAQALEGATASAAGLETLQPDWQELLRDFETTARTLEKIFLR